MVASRMLMRFILPFRGWTNHRPCCQGPAGERRVRRDLRSGAKRTFELFYSGVRESELHSGAHGAAQRADAEGRQSL